MPTKRPLLALIIRSAQPALLTYISSGWAFFIPYLAAYLLYALFDLPINPANNDASICLFHVYWMLHGIHLVIFIGALALYFTQSNDYQNRQISSPARHARYWALLPWSCLFLIYFIPGIYLEFPGDIWEHYTRINDYGVNTVLGDVGTWRKSSYFLAYTLIRSMPATHQVFWLNYYNTGMCLLLCWQYYRLARQVSITPRAAFVFVLLQAFTFGNSAFSFYRYYGLSSTILAQIAAVALVNYAIEHAQKTQVSGRLAADARIIGCGALLLLLMSYNHVQSLGFAALCLLGITFWQARQHTLLWAATGILLASALTIAGWPTNSAPFAAYRAQGWLSSWYGFNLLSLDSPAGQRGIQILGGAGLLNLIAGGVLLRRNHLVGWLTVVPALALLSPVVALPFAAVLARTSSEYITVFARMLLSIPAGLAIVTTYQIFINAGTDFADQHKRRYRISPIFITICCMLIFLTLPPGSPYYNRLWHVLAVPPTDLTLLASANDMTAVKPVKDVENLHLHSLVTTDAMGFVAHATGLRGVVFNNRLIGYPKLRAPATAAQERLHYLKAPVSNITVYTPSPQTLYSSNSFGGLVSGHWNPHEVALAYAAGPETTQSLISLGAQPTFCRTGIMYQFK